MRTHVLWLRPTERLPAICGKATFAIEVSSTSMKVARVTVSSDDPVIHGRSNLGAPVGVRGVHGRSAPLERGRLEKFVPAGPAPITESEWSDTVLNRSPALGPVGFSWKRTEGTTERPMKSGVSTGFGCINSIRTGSRWVTFT